MVKIAPSLISADFTRLGEEIDAIKTADYLHFDVMDGVFVPNLSLGFAELASVRKYTDMTLDVHLMITSPARYTARFVETGADIVVFHVEAETPENIGPAIDEIHSLGKRAGLSVRPGTPAQALLPYIHALDIVLVMTVEPGFGGQAFMPSMLPKIAELRRIIDDRGLQCELEVDGGVYPDTAKLCIQAGADVLVAGNGVFPFSDRASRIAELRRCATLEMTE